MGFLDTNYPAGLDNTTTLPDYNDPLTTGSIDTLQGATNQSAHHTKHNVLAHAIIAIQKFLGFTSGGQTAPLNNTALVGGPGGTSSWSTVSVAAGGTGATTLLAHGLLVGEGTSAIATISPGTVNWVLTSNGSGSDPTFQNLPGALLPDPVTVSHGGTGDTTLTLNGVLYGNGTSTVQATAQGPANSVLTANAGAPAFSATPTVTSLTTTGAVAVGSVVDYSQNPPSGAATTVTNGATVASANGVERLTSAAAVTGLILTAGTVAGQQVEVVNTNTSGTMTFDVSGTSHVANGTNSVIQPNTGICFAWDSVEALWYPVGGAGGGGTSAFVDQFLSQSGTTITLSQTPGVILGVWVNGVAQRKTTDWSLSGAVITFVSTLVSDDVIVAYTASTASLGGNISVVEQEFANASGTTVTLNQTNIGGVMMVARNGVVQRQVTDYTVNTGTGVITFTTTLSSEQISVAFFTGGGGTGNASTLNGFTTSTSKANNTIPVTDGSGHIPTGESYGLRSRTIILNGTTSYTYPTNTQAITVKATGAGGGGGGCATAASASGSGNGGGGGGYSESFITSLPASPVTVAVGAGGGGGSAGANNGVAGNDTTFNVTTVVAHGGSLGTGQTASAGSGLISNGAVGASVGTGDVAIAGGNGMAASSFGTNGAIVSNGGRGSGPYGGDGGLGSNGNTGNAGNAYGGGGSGGAVSNGSASKGGGNGANGIMVIEEYY